MATMTKSGKTCFETSTDQLDWWQRPRESQWITSSSWYVITNLYNKMLKMKMTVCGCQWWCQWWWRWRSAMSLNRADHRSRARQQVETGLWEKTCKIDDFAAVKNNETAICVEKKDVILHFAFYNITIGVVQKKKKKQMICILWFPYYPTMSKVLHRKFPYKETGASQNNLKQSKTFQKMFQVLPPCCRLSQSASQIA